MEREGVPNNPALGTMVKEEIGSCIFIHVTRQLLTKSKLMVLYILTPLM